MSAANPEKSRWWLKPLEHPYWLTAVAVVLLLTAIVLPFAWRYYRTQQLVRVIEANGGTVSFNLNGPEWVHANLSGLLASPFTVPARVYIMSDEMDDAEFRESVLPLNELHGLWGLIIGSSAISKTSLDELDQFQDLRFLTIQHEEVDDDTLLKIGKLKNLSSLTLDHTEITNDGIRHLQGLKNLTDLSVVNTGVTEQGFEELQRRLPGLQISDD